MKLLDMKTDFAKHITVSIIFFTFTNHGRWLPGFSDR